MARLDDINAIRSVEFARSYLWQIWFPSIVKGPFTGWFPATEVEEPFSEITSHSFTIGNHEYKVPQGQGSLALRVTFIDDATHSLFNWIEEWVDTIIPLDRRGVASLEASIRKCHVMALSPQKKVIRTRRYDVYPEGSIANSYNSSPSVKTFSMTFSVVGITRG